MWSRLDDQLRFYGGSSRGARRAYLSLKIAQMVCAAAIPVVAAVDGAASWRP